MSGHSKWHKIQHKKAVVDSKRSKLFSQFSRDIKIAARHGIDPDKNATLRDAIDRAKKSNFPQVNIDRLLNKDTAAVTSATYEGYGSGGTAVLISVQTDNTNRTVSDMRAILKNNNGSLGEPGSVRWKFSPRIQAQVRSGGGNIEPLELAAIDGGAIDISTADNTSLLVTINISDQERFRKIISDIGGIIENEENIFFVPEDQKINLDEDQASKLVELVNELAKHDEVVAVYSDALQFD